MNDIERYEKEVELHVIPPLCPLDVSPVDFSRSQYLIERAYAASAEWLVEAPRARGQRELLGFHRHAVTPKRGTARHSTNQSLS